MTQLKIKNNMRCDRVHAKGSFTVGNQEGRNKPITNNKPTDRQELRNIDTWNTAEHNLNLC